MPTVQPTVQRSARRLMSRALPVAGVVLAAMGFLWLWWRGVPAVYRDAGGGPDAENARLNAVTTTRAALLIFFVGLGAVATFWLNGRVYRITARTSQVTDRYAKAIEQLGADTLDVRLAGIYALEQIAADSPRARDQAVIVEVLGAFVRVHSDVRYPCKAALGESAEPDSAVAEIRSGYGPPPADVQAAVTVLGRLPARDGVRRADLTGAWLRGANLVEANLKGAKLLFAELTYANLRDANLTEADLHEANLSNGYLVGANLRRADLYGTNLAGAHLDGAYLGGADLSGAVHLSPDQVDAAYGNAWTQLPDGVPMPLDWPP